MLFGVDSGVGKDAARRIDRNRRQDTAAFVRPRQRQGGNPHDQRLVKRVLVQRELDNYCSRASEYIAGWTLGL